MLVLSSPSGAGKTTISRKLLDQDENLTMSVSATTRPRRSGEVEGKDYYFLGEPEFTEMVEKGDLLEYARVFGNFYGTPKKPVEDALTEGKDVLFDIDWQGTQHLYDNDSTRDDLVSVFILPPDTVELEKRLRRRARDPEEVVRERMSKAADEMSHYREYNYIIVNTDIENSVAEVQSILAAERHRIDRQIGLHDFVQDLRGLTD
ncbi:MAG: guanylate kinase [Rhodospirillaceae bacterium]|jgi:guanylate kinase|nr:guanylate kinase [Rhodospirillaceae bacterium]|tara:strand:+ start:275 stop:889 length:615 start_codon:yes stop_codon:yes gene_type:complete